MGYMKPIDPSTPKRRAEAVSKRLRDMRERGETIHTLCSRNAEARIAGTLKMRFG